MSNTAIKVEDLSKIYRLGEIGTGTISRDMERWFKTKVLKQEDPFLKIGETNDRANKGKSDIVYSLQDINFEIQQGDAVGIIGRNGAGKSTLLKILSRVTTPTTGRINIKGRVASLLEVGTGFHPELTGRENIYLNGAILGMRKREIDRKLDEIIDFSGVERYIDTPVKRYSSGMYVRLAFAVAAHLESEILIVDEVLAVGDAEFQKKCLGKMGEVSKGEGRTVLFVSHNMEAIKMLCTSGIYLQNGQLNFYSNITQAINSYRKHDNIVDGLQTKWSATIRNFTEIIAFSEIHSTYLEDENCLIIKTVLVSDIKGLTGFLAFDVSTNDEFPIFQAIPSFDPFIKFQNGPFIVETKIELPKLIPGIYRVSAWVGPTYNETYEWQRNVLSFSIEQSPQKNRPFPHHSGNGSFVCDSKYKII